MEHRAMTRALKRKNELIDYLIDYHIQQYEKARFRHRDEIEQLRAENDQLHAEIAQCRRSPFFSSAELDIDHECVPVVVLRHTRLDPDVS